MGMCGLGKRLHFDEINNENVLTGANLIFQVLEITFKSLFSCDAAITQSDLPNALQGHPG